jgi:hypothetical protein
MELDQAFVWITQNSSRVPAFSFRVSAGFFTGRELKIPER